MKPCFFLVVFVLCTIWMTGCDLEPVVWDGSHYMPLELPSDHDAGDMDGGF